MLPPLSLSSLSPTPETIEQSCLDLNLVVTLLIRVLGRREGYTCRKYHPDKGFLTTGPLDHRTGPGPHNGDRWAGSGGCDYKTARGLRLQDRTGAGGCDYTTTRGLRLQDRTVVAITRQHEGWD